MFKTSNKKISFNNKKYEIFWVTDFVLHIIQREKHESHKINLKEVEDFATSCTFIPYNKNVTLGLGKFNGAYYQIVSYIIEFPNKRCVIKTCHRVSAIKIIELCKQKLS